MTTRRGFIGAILAAAAAPAFVKAGVLMPTRKIIVPEPLKVPEIEIFSQKALKVGGGHGLHIGDVITISGVAGSFVIKSFSGSSGVVGLHPMGMH